MLAAMNWRTALWLTGFSFFVVSCGNDADTPILAGDTRAAAAKGDEIYLKAKQADDAGNRRRAIKFYDKTATEYPFAKSGAMARYRHAQLLEEKGDILGAFKAYGKFLERYPGSDMYTSVLNRQVNMAQSAAEGQIKTNFLGIKSKLSLEKTVEMLDQLRKHAPRSRIASKAHFTKGQLYESKRKGKEAIAAYRELVREQPDSPEAPEALFRVGVILMDDAKRGNQNQANLDLAREAFNDYLIQYPGHSRNAEARRHLQGVAGQDLQRSYDIAEFYLKTGKTESAKVYYRDIVRRGGDDKIRSAAQARLKELGE
jgi:outer membrane protein assembly factor BamD (BamD/ComL family)